MDDTIYTMEEVAEYFKVTLSAVKNWIEDGRIEATYVGSERRITGEAIRRFLADSKAAALARKGSRRAYNARKRALEQSAGSTDSALAAELEGIRI